MPFNPTYASVKTEECDLHYWYQGTGPLLVMVPGGNGIGRQYNKIFEHLDETFTVCTYDRRQHSDSTVKKPTKLNPAQQARDIIAVIKAVGREKASIYGNSGGGVISLQLAVSYPEYIDHVVVHEAPTASLLDDSTWYLDWAFMLHNTYLKDGVAAAARIFFKQMKGYGDDWPSTGSKPSPEDEENFWRNEFLQLSTYCPDLRRIIDNHVSIAVAAGVRSADAFYVRTTIEQAKILGCPSFVLPGHHTGHEHEAAAFAPELLAVFKHLETARQK